MEKFGANGLSQVCNYSLDEQRAITFWSLISSYNYKANFLKKKNCGLDLSNICFYSYQLLEQFKNVIFFEFLFACFAAPVRGRNGTNPLILESGPQ